MAPSWALARHATSSSAVELSAPASADEKSLTAMVQRVQKALDQAERGRQDEAS
jgi:hypothetical protein